MKTRWLISCMVIVLVTLGSGCATLPSTEQMALDISGYELPKQPPAESALVYVVRPSMLGTFVRFNVFLDDQQDSSEMGYTRGSEYIYFFVSPGPHTIFSKAENWAEFGVTAKAGEVIFLKQNPAIGLIMARNNLEQVPDTEGKYHIKNTKLGTIIKEQKQ